MASTTWGKVLDQASIIKSAFQEIEKACIKATRHDDMVPKEKHVRRLILCTHERSDLSEQIYGHLAKRLELPDWIVVLKTLVVFHRLFRDGNPRFLADLKWKGTIFPLNRFIDPTSEEARVQSVFIRKYALYLEEKVLVFRALKMEFEKEPTLLKGLSVEDSFVRLPKLQRQLDALINCQTSAEAITNPITSLAFEMLLKDSFKLYRGLNDAVITLLESYFTLEKSLAANALDIYKAFMRETSAIIAMYEMAKKKFTLELPELKHAPTTLVNSMEDYIKDVEEGRRADPSRAAAGGRGPQPPSPQADAPSLIDGFSEPAVPPAGRSAASFDLFGAPAGAPPQQQAGQNLFDPFGDAFATPAIAPAPAARQNSQRQTSSQNFQGALDPFASSPNAVASANKVSYEEKALHIKAAFAPALQPTSPTITPNAPAGAPPTYPKPNYNVSFGGPQPVPGYPVGAPAPYPGAPYNQYVGSPQMQYQNPMGVPYNAQQPPYGAPPAQPAQSNPFF